MTDRLPPEARLDDSERYGFDDIWRLLHPWPDSFLVLNSGINKTNAPEKKLQKYITDQRILKMWAWTSEQLMINAIVLKISGLQNIIS